MTTVSATSSSEGKAKLDNKYLYGGAALLLLLAVSHIWIYNKGKDAERLAILSIPVKHDTTLIREPYVLPPETLRVPVVRYRMTEPGVIPDRDNDCCEMLDNILNSETIYHDSSGGKHRIYFSDGNLVPQELFTARGERLTREITATTAVPLNNETPWLLGLGLEYGNGGAMRGYFGRKPIAISLGFGPNQVPSYGIFAFVEF